MTHTSFARGETSPTRPHPRPASICNEAHHTKRRRLRAGARIWDHANKACARRGGRRARAHTRTRVTQQRVTRTGLAGSWCSSVAAALIGRTRAAGRRASRTVASIKRPLRPPPPPPPPPSTDMTGDEARDATLWCSCCSLVNERSTVCFWNVLFYFRRICHFISRIKLNYGTLFLMGELVRSRMSI